MNLTSLIQRAFGWHRVILVTAPLNNTSILLYQNNKGNIFFGRKISYLFMIFMFCCFGANAQIETRTASQCLQSNQRVKQTLDNNNELFYFIQKGVIGNGITYPWMAKMKMLDIRQSFAEIAFKIQDEDVSLTVNNIRFYNGYYNNMPMVDFANWADKQQLQDDLKEQFLNEARKFLKTFKIGKNKCGKLYLDLLDDGCLPSPAVMPEIGPCSSDADDLGAGSATNKNNNEAELLINVADRNGSFIEGANVSLEDEAKKSHPATYLEKGEYKALLSKGFYKLNISKKGFCAETREIFEATPSEKIHFNVTLKVCSIEDIIVYKGSESGFLTQYRYPYKEDVIKINNDGKLKMQIQYGGKEATLDKVYYRSSQDLDERIRAIVRYNKDTITADTIIFFPEKKILQAVGNVIVDKGLKQTKFRQVSFKAQNDSLLLTN